MCPGELWLAKVSGQRRPVRIVASSSTPGRWICIDLVTDATVSIRAEDFISKWEPPREGNSP